jgi:protein subunit release factor A
MTTNIDTKPSATTKFGPARLEIRPGVGGEDAKNFSLTLAEALLSHARNIDPRAQLVKGPTLTLLL